MASLNKATGFLIFCLSALLTLGFSSAYRHLRQTHQKTSSFINLDELGIDGIGIDFSDGSNHGFGIGLGSGGDSNNNNDNNNNNNEAGDGEVVVDFPGLDVPGISIPPISIPGIPGAVIPGIGLPGVSIRGGGVEVGSHGTGAQLGSHGNGAQLGSGAGGGGGGTRNDPPWPCEFYVPGFGCLNAPGPPATPAVHAQPSGVHTIGTSIQRATDKHQKMD